MATRTNRQKTRRNKTVSRCVNLEIDIRWPEPYHYTRRIGSLFNYLIKDQKKAMKRFSILLETTIVITCTINDKNSLKM